MAETNIAEAFKDILESYRQRVQLSLDDALEKCADEYIDELRKTAPRRVRGDTIGKPYAESFAKRWKANGHDVIYVGNTKTVSDREHSAIPLINLLEYGRGPAQKGKRPHMNVALLATMDKMQQIIENEIKGVK